MRRLLFWAGGLLLFVPVVFGQDDPKQAANPAKAIITEYQAAQKEASAAIREAKTAEERKEAFKKQPKADAYAKRLLKVAKANPKSEAAADAVIWIANVGSRTKEASEAVALLLEHHPVNAAVTPQLLDRVAFIPNPQMDKLLETVAKHHPNAATQEAAAAISKFLIGKVVPDIRAEDTDGKEFKLSDYRGKVVLLDFWGHW
jgi:hypothetical protein